MPLAFTQEDFLVCSLRFILACVDHNKIIYRSYGRDLGNIFYIYFNISENHKGEPANFGLVTLLVYEGFSWACEAKKY